MSYDTWRLGISCYQVQSHYIEVAQGGVSSRAIHNWLWIFSLFWAKIKIKIKINKKIIIKEILCNSLVRMLQCFFKKCLPARLVYNDSATYPLFTWPSMEFPVLDRRPKVYGRSQRFKTYGYGGRSLRKFLRPKVLFVFFLVFFQNGGWHADFLCFSLHKCHLFLD